MRFRHIVNRNVEIYSLQELYHFELNCLKELTETQSLWYNLQCTVPYRYRKKSLCAYRQVGDPTRVDEEQHGLHDIRIKVHDFQPSSGRLL